MEKKELVTKENLLQVLDLLDASGIRYWLDGGWGVDALFGQQSREHRDVDIDFDAVYTEKLLQLLQEQGYRLETDWLPVRAELHHPQLGYLDIHPFVLEEAGKAKQADLEGGWYLFEADYFGAADFAGREIPCISPKGQKIFHSGYELREKDRHDLQLIEKLLEK
ncbi:MAG: aminoglycoside adenylyltransferase [Firmicutes bacterium]|nr:aminoglycoside adenylyltransferase [Bacillota bacterium]